MRCPSQTVSSYAMSRPEISPLCEHPLRCAELRSGMVRQPVREVRQLRAAEARAGGGAGAGEGGGRAAEQVLCCYVLDHVSVCRMLWSRSVGRHYMFVWSMVALHRTILIVCMGQHPGVPQQLRAHQVHQLHPRAEGGASRLVLEPSIRLFPGGG
eukprot:3066137-Rhodomonas_salina.2